MTADSAAARLRHLVGDGVLRLPDPGAGETAARWRSLFELSRDEDVSVARLAEAHVDAVSILHESGVEPHPGATYAVWASVGRGGRDVALDQGTLHGTKPFCSGVGTVDRALIDVSTPNGRQLVEVALDPIGEGADRSHGRTWEPTGSWGTHALGDTATSGIEFHGHPVVRCIGDTGWYLRRTGFWHGACGPAACWAGAAAGLPARRCPDDGELSAARYGALLAEVSLLEAALTRAGDRIDSDPSDARIGRIVALSTRAVVHDSCLRIADGFSRLFGPRALTDPEIARRHADTLLYVRQFHADDDLVALTHAALGES